MYIIWKKCYNWYIIYNSRKIKLKIYDLEYIIEFNNDKYIIYHVLYRNIKHTYNSLNELFGSYMIYNEPVITSIDRIRILNINM